jgi:hypothetical protein
MRVLRSASWLVSRWAWPLCHAPWPRHAERPWGFRYGRVPRKWKIGVSWLVLGVMAGAPSSAFADAPGTALAQRVYDRPDGTDVSFFGEMRLTEQGRSPRIRRLVSYRKERGVGEIYNLIRFTAPPDIAGTGLLTLDHSAAETDQWIYLPGLDRVRRIAASRQGGRFVGSDVYYEDLRDRKVPMDIHRIVGRETVAGTTCDVLESVPANPGNSVYKKRLTWVDPTTLLPMRIDYFEKSLDSPSKRWTLEKKDKVQGYWTVLASTMEDLGSGHRTEVVAEKVVYDRGLPDELFSARALEDEALESAHRP